MEITQLYLLVGLILLTSIWAWIVYCGEDFENNQQGIGVLILVSMASIVWPILIILTIMALVIKDE
jgi:hypothetical protein